jgi:hypothetical protein
MLVAVTPVTLEIGVLVDACVSGPGAAPLEGAHALAAVAVKAAKTRSDRRTPQAYCPCVLPENRRRYLIGVAAMKVLMIALISACLSS